MKTNTDTYTHSLSFLDSSSEEIVIPPSEFAMDMLTAVNNKEFADMTIETKNKQNVSTVTYAHKAILASRNDYFKVMLNPNCAFLERGKTFFAFPEITQV
jgi:hypothetical protein